MRIIRKGNDIEIIWKFFTGEGDNRKPYVLTDKNLTLYMSGETFRKKKVDNFIRNNDSIKWMYWGKDQRYIGIHSLELVLNEGMIGMVTVDECDAFSIVNHYCSDEDTSNDGVGFTVLTFETTINESVCPTPSEPTIEVDESLSLSSENPVQNKAITKEINQLKDDIQSIVDYEVVEEIVTPEGDIDLSGYATVKWTQSELEVLSRRIDALTEAASWDIYTNNNS